MQCLAISFGINWMATTLISRTVTGINIFSQFRYILPNLIAMGVPGEGLATQWRNNISDVSKFLNTKYGTKYRIWNLTGKHGVTSYSYHGLGESYNYSYFNNQVLDFGFPDHHPPPLALMWDCVSSMHNWISSGVDHIGVVHCLAGRFGSLPLAPKLTIFFKESDWLYCRGLFAIVWQIYIWRSSNFLL